MANATRLKFALRSFLCLTTLLVAGSGGYLLGLTIERSGAPVTDLNPQLAYLAGSRAGRQAVAHELIEGRMTFQTAIERFETLSNHNPDYIWDTFRGIYAGMIDHDRYARQVISFVTVELSEKPDQAGALSARLEAELLSSGNAGAVPVVE